MKLLAISGSLRDGSSNTAILRSMASTASDGVTVTLFDGLDDLPHFSPERDVEPAPASVARLRNAITESAGVVFCTPEYAFGMPGVLKNALDWTVSSGSLDGKPVAVLSAGPGGGLKAHASLSLTLTALGTRQLPETALSIKNTRAKIDDGGQITDAETMQQLHNVLMALVGAIEDEATVTQ